MPIQILCSKFNVRIQQVLTFEQGPTFVLFGEKFSLGPGLWARALGRSTSRLLDGLLACTPLMFFGLLTPTISSVFLLPLLWLSLLSLLWLLLWLPLLPLLWLLWLLLVLTLSLFPRKNTSKVHHTVKRGLSTSLADCLATTEYSWTRLWRKLVFPVFQRVQLDHSAVVPG